MVRNIIARTSCLMSSNRLRSSGACAITKLLQKLKTHFRCWPSFSSARQRLTRALVRNLRQINLKVVKRVQLDSHNLRPKRNLLVHKERNKRLRRQTKQQQQLSKKRRKKLSRKHSQRRKDSLNDSLAETVTKTNQRPSLLQKTSQSQELSQEEQTKMLKWLQLLQLP